MGVVAVSFLAATAAPFPFAFGFIVLMAKSNPSKNFLNSGSTRFWVFYKILVQIFNKCRGCIGDIGKIFHQNKIGNCWNANIVQNL